MDYVELEEQALSRIDSEEKNEYLTKIVRELEISRRMFQKELGRLRPVRNNYYKILSFKDEMPSDEISSLLKPFDDIWKLSHSLLTKAEEEGLSLQDYRGCLSSDYGEIYMFYSEAFCVLDNLDLRKLYNFFLKQNKEEIFVKHVGSQFSCFFKEIKRKKELVGGGMFFKLGYLGNIQSFIYNKKRSRWLQDEVLRASCTFTDSFFSEENLTKKDLKKHFSSFLKAEVESFLNFFSVVDHKLILPSYSSIETEGIREVFKKNLELVFTLKLTKWELTTEEENGDGEKLLTELRFTRFLTEFSDETSYGNCLLSSFFQEMCLVVKQEGKTKSEEMSFFLEMSDIILDNPGYIAWEIAFFSEEIDSLCCEGWKVCRGVYKKLIILIKEEKNLAVLRNNYCKFLFLDFTPSVSLDDYRLYDEPEIKKIEEVFFKKKEENIRKIKKFCRVFWIKNKEKEKLVQWRGCVFPVQEALDYLEEACLVYNDPILEIIYNSFLKKGKEKCFVKLVNLFRKKIEKEMFEDKKPFFISDQSQEWLWKKILETAEDLDKSSSLENNDIKKTLISIYEAEIESLNEILERRFKVLCMSSFDKYKEKEVILSILELNSSLGLSPEELSLMFCQHLKTVSNFKVFNWREDEKNISGKEEFVEFWNFRERLLNSPWDYLYQFEKEIEEKTKKEEWIRSRRGKIKTIWWGEKQAKDFYFVGDNFCYESWDFSCRLTRIDRNICSICNPKQNEDSDIFFLKERVIAGFIVFLILGVIFLILWALKRKNNYLQKKKQRKR